VLEREPLPLPTLEIVNSADLKGVDGLLKMKYEDLRLDNYVSAGKIAAPVAV
jgi:thymidylate synthase